MNVVDSSAWLSYLASDSNSAVFAEPIEKLSQLLVPSITITEVFKNVLRQRGEDAALIVTAHMEQGKVIPLDSELAKDPPNSAFSTNCRWPIALFSPLLRNIPP